MTVLVILMGLAVGHVSADENNPMAMFRVLPKSGAPPSVASHAAGVVRKTSGATVVNSDACTTLTFEGLELNQLIDPVSSPFGVTVDNGDPKGALAFSGNDENGGVSVRGWPSPSTGVWPRKRSVEFKFTKRSCSTMSVGSCWS